MNCDRQLMTDPCIAALRRLIANPAARTEWRERLRCSRYLHEASMPNAATPGMTFRITAQQGAPTLPVPHRTHIPTTTSTSRSPPLCSTLTVSLLTELARLC
jgi:hypothetical protein